MPGVIAAAAWWAVAAAGEPAFRLLLHRRAGRGKEVAERLPERRGHDDTPRPPGPLIWLHAASVGETVSAIPVVEALRDRAAVLMTTGTVTSARVFEQRCPGVLHRFVPLDVPRWVDRFIDHWRPDAAAFLESELWPNLLAACRRRGVRLLLLNARLSERSHDVWARTPGFARRVIGAFDAVWAQSPEDAERLRALSGGQVTAPGNLKFAAPPLPADPAELARLTAIFGDRPRWLAASTHPGEEEIAAAIHRALLPEFPDLLTAVAPRHPERGVRLAAQFAAPRRGAGEDPPLAGGGIWIADGMGEMGLLYRLFPTVFVGKSLAGEGGGQNPLEPARLGCAVAAGPLMANQKDAAAVLASSGGLATVSGEAALRDWVGRMLRDSAARAAAGAAAERAASADAALPGRAADLLLAMARGRA